MASDFFNNIPKVLYGDNIAKNLLVSSKLRDSVIGNGKAFLKYTIKEGETPEFVATRFYGSHEYAWIIYLANHIVDPYHDWPMPYLEFVTYIKQKYGSVPAAKGNIEYYQHDDYTFTINQSTYERYSNASFVDSTLSVSRAGWKPVYSYDREVNENDQKRNIDILHPIHLQQVQREIESIYE